MPDKPLYSIILLPKENYWAWVAGAKDYDIKFAVTLTAEPDTAGRHFAPQQIVTIVDAANGYPEYGNINTWFAQNYPQIKVDRVAAQSPDELQRLFAKRIEANDRYLPLQPVFDFGSLWPSGKCLIGLHGRADGRMGAADFAAIAQARVEAVKLTSTAAPEDVDSLRAINSKMFIMVRLFDDLRDRMVSAEDFASHVVEDMRRFYERGIRYFEVHNEVNLKEEGWGLSWQNGREFAQWFLDVQRNLKFSFPEAKFGWPGLSPDGFPVPNRTNDLRFLDEAETALRAADFICAHCYWRDEAEMVSPLGGMSWREYRRRYPEKLLFVSEFSNPLAGTALQDKGAQYVRYYQTLRTEPGLGAAFSFVASASVGFSHETWRAEDGRLSAIVSAVGARAWA
ncbi:MAG: hypothetical protein ACT4QE_00115 [Anaerolineales bacterium]